MPLLYYARQSQLKTKDGVKQWHLTLKKVGRAVSLQQLGEMVAEKCSATPGDVHNVIRNLMSVMRMQLLNSRTVRLDGLGTFTVIARTRIFRSKHEVQGCYLIRVYILLVIYPLAPCPAALGTTRALWQGVEFEKWTGGTATDGNEGSDDGNGGNAGGGGGLDENPLG